MVPNNATILHGHIHVPGLGSWSFYYLQERQLFRQDDASVRAVPCCYYLPLPASLNLPVVVYLPP
jgi:hypothetical protein